MPESDIKPEKSKERDALFGIRFTNIRVIKKENCSSGTFFSANNAHFVIVTESHNIESGINRKNSIKIEFKFIPGNM